MDAAALVLTATLLADWGQTRYIIKHPEQYHETNVYLGAHPSSGRINVYFATVIGVGLLLPPSWQWALSAFEISVIAHNRSIGVRVSF